MVTKKIVINNREDTKLSCLLDLPDGKPIAYALFAHCFTCSKNLKAAYHIGHTLAERGIACLRFDFTGIGETEGNFENTTFSSDVKDIIDVSTHLSQHYESPYILVGHSLGGTAMIKAAGKIESAKAVVTIGSPYDPAYILKLINKKSDIKNNESKKVTLGDKQFIIKDQFITDLEESDISDDISNLKKALLIMHSPIDNIVPIENAMRIFMDAKHPKSFISLGTSDHLISNQADSIYTGNLISTWVSRYISLPEDNSESESIDNRVTAQTGKNSYKTDIFAGNHHLIADEPKSVGGTDEGPDPYDYLLASLGSCTTMTVMMYANRKGWNLESVEVSLDHTKIHASDCEECESKTGKVDFIERNIKFVGEINEEQINRLTEIADKCPVHRTLHSEIVVKTSIIE